MKWLAIAFVLLVVVPACVLVYGRFIANPRVADELRTQPDGSRGAKAMLLTLPSGRELPVNYLREDATVYVGADGPWWRELRDDSAVGLLIRGERFEGRSRVVLDDPELTRAVFERLRPTAPAWLPDWLNGKLIVIELGESAMSNVRGN